MTFPLNVYPRIFYTPHKFQNILIHVQLYIPRHMDILIMISFFFKINVDKNILKRKNEFSLNDFFYFVVI